MEEILEQRTNFIDFIKGIAIFLMLYGHSLQYGSGADFLQSGQYWENNVMKAIYSFHMPLFITISGYLFWFSIQRHGMLNSVKKRITTLLPICVTWAILLWGIDAIYKHQYNVKGLIVLVFTDFWFLSSVLFCVIVTAFLDSIANKNIKAISCVMVAICFFIIPDFYLMSAHKFMMPYFACGYACAKYNLLDKLSSIKNTACIICLCMWGGLLLLYNKNSYIYITGITLKGKSDIYQQLLIDGNRYLIGFVGVIAAIYLSHMLLNKLHNYNNKVLSVILEKMEYIGRNSIEFYILSTYMFIYIVPRLTTNFELNYFIILLETIIIIVVCALIGKLLKRLGIVGKLLIGK